jgi:hypothetical protein
MMARELPLPVRPRLDALLAQRAQGWRGRRPLARALAEAIAAHPPHRWPRYLEWICLKTTDRPRPTRPRKEAPMPGGIVVNEEDLSPEERRPVTAPHSGLTPERLELAARQAERRRKTEARRQAWLESSGFAAVIERAEALLADLPRAINEHQLAQATVAPLADFIALAAEEPDDWTLQRFARRAADLARSIQRAPLLAESAPALRELIAKVKGADLDGVNGPVRNSNVVAAWKRHFTELLSPLPQPGHAERCQKQAQSLLAEARAARERRP